MEKDSSMAEEPNANEPRFIVTCENADISKSRVVRFNGTDCISKPYQFEIVVTSEKADIDVESVINKQLSLLLQRKEEYFPYTGIVTSFKYVETTVDYTNYTVTLCPSLWLLSLNVQSRVFQKMTVPDIIEKVLKDADLSDYYKMDVQSYPEREYVVQYEESDLNFISRLMETCGIWFFFQEDPVSLESGKGYSKTEKMIITDKPAGFKDVSTLSTVKFRTRSGMVNRMDDADKESIHHLELGRRIIPKEVLVKGYNYRTPEIDLANNQNVTDGDSGRVYEYKPQP
jgi:type VI secretion system secreted protein VgrG